MEQPALHKALISYEGVPYPWILGTHIVFVYLTSKYVMTLYYSECSIVNSLCIPTYSSIAKIIIVITGPEAVCCLVLTLYTYYFNVSAFYFNGLIFLNAFCILLLATTYKRILHYFVSPSSSIKHYFYCWTSKAVRSTLFCFCSMPLRNYF